MGWLDGAVVVVVLQCLRFSDATEAKEATERMGNNELP